MSKWKLSTLNRKSSFGSWKPCSSIKKKIVKGNQAPFVNKELRKVIYTRSRLQNKYWKNPTSEKEVRYKQQRNKFVSLRKKSMTLYLNKLTADGIVTNKSFWKFIKPFLKSKCCYEQNNVILIQNDQIITEEKDLVETFTKHYIDIVEVEWNKTSQCRYDA